MNINYDVIVVVVVSCYNVSVRPPTQDNTPNGWVFPLVQDAH